MKTFIIAAITADGLIGRDASHLADWTGKADKKLFVEVTKQAGVIVMGSRTFETIGRALPGRRTIVYTSKPETIDVEGVEATNEAPADLIARLEKEGAAGLAICGGSSIYTLFMAANVVDELYLSIVPKLFGKGVPLFNQELDVDLILQETRALGEDTTLLRFSVAK